MAYENNILSQNLEFYSAYGYEEREESGTEKNFTRVLWKILLVLSLLFAMFFTYNYVVKMNIDFKKFDFLNIEKMKESLFPESNGEVIHTESKIEIREVDSKRVETEPLIQEVIKELHKKRVVEVSKIELSPINKSTKEISQEQVKKPYLLDEYLEAIKKELGKN